MKVKIKVKKIDDEFQVIPYVNDKPMLKAIYFTDDKRDAMQTAEAMAKEYEAIPCH